MSDFYDWDKTFTYDAEITMVVGARGIGKTYGLRKKVLEICIEKGYRFVEVCRYKNELDGLTRGYFDRLSHDEELEDFMFKSDTRFAYVGKKVLKDGDKKEKVEWNLIGYFIPMSGSQKYKKNTYDNVRFIIVDECVLDKMDRFHHYLPNEFGILAGIVDTVSRERPGVKSIKPRVFLLGNACDVTNPYMTAYGVGTDVTYGYRWYGGKRFLLHYVKDDEYSKAKSEETVAGHMYQIAGGGVAVNNIFDIGTDDFIEKKTPKSVFKFGVICNGEMFGIWVDADEGLYFISNKIPNKPNNIIYSLTLKDNRVNYIAAKKASDILRHFVDLHYYGVIRYENSDIKLRFEKVLTLLGIK